MEVLKWIEKWHQGQCDGYWEHSYSINIESLDNPGWHISIDVHETSIEDVEVEYQLIENSPNDWYGFSIKDCVYRASGDPSKLEFLLNKFRELIESI